jgi:hypothetical protein
LVAVTIKNIKCLAGFVSKVSKAPVWIGSWNGDNYRNADIALFTNKKSSAIAVPRQKKLKGLCQEQEKKRDY